MKNKELLENIKDQVISEVFQNNKLSLEEKMIFCQELEKFGEGWRNVIFAPELEKKKNREKNDWEMEKLRRNLSKV